jgi:diketogulonate reductase-like aldo/keto reductase
MDDVTVQNTRIPVLGLGTYPMKGSECHRAVETALELGYRHIDTARMYENEAAVGEAIRNSAVPRDEIFLVTKIRSENLAPDDLFKAVDTSLDQLGTYIDLLLIHSPSLRVPIADSIQAMNECQERGDVSHIGVSNFSIDQLERAIEASRTAILTNQVKYHPFEDRGELLSYCIDHDIALTAYSPLGRGRVLGNDVLQEVGNTYGKTEAQVALRWLLQQENVVAIPKASSREHLVENMAVFDFELTDEEMEQIFGLQGGIADRFRSALGL